MKFGIAQVVWSPTGPHNGAVPQPALRALSVASVTVRDQPDRFVASKGGRRG